MPAIIDTKMLWRQFAAAIDMLGGALHECPDELWEANLWEDQPGQSDESGFSAFWYLGYHTLFWLDLYLTGTDEGFAPPPPSDLTEKDEGGALPRTYTREELNRYLEHCRRTCRDVIGAMDEIRAAEVCRFGWGEMRFAELQMYNLRHVQEHAAQLGMFLGQRMGTGVGWIGQAQ